jgi:hypothetical protein
MKRSLGIFGTLFLGLFVVAAAPVQAANTDERIKALEQELIQLKADQHKVEQDQLVLKDHAEDALAKRAKAPKIKYRSGRGLSIRGGDRSWEIKWGAQWQVQTSFFPSGKADQNEDDEGPSEGSTFMRHLEFDFNYLWDNGFYQIGATMDYSRAGAQKKDKMVINFNKWSPYYPQVKLGSAGGSSSAANIRSSSTGGYAIERAPLYDAQYTTGSANNAYGLFWSKIPFGPGRIDKFDVSLLTKSLHSDADFGQNADGQVGWSIGATLSPFRSLKGSPLKGLKLGVNFIKDWSDGGTGSQGDEVMVRTRNRQNRVTILDFDTRGSRQYVNPWISYTNGPVELIASWDKHESERDFTGTGGSKIDDLDMNTSAGTVAIWVWSPKGGAFTGNRRNGGLRASYTFLRHDWDAGTGGGTGNDFSGRARNHLVENIAYLRWFQRPNMSWGIQWTVSELSHLEGTGGGATTSRRRLGVGAKSGGQFSNITLNTVWKF